MWIVIFMLLTPATWNGLIEYVHYVSKYALNFDRWHDYILFNGNMLHPEYTGIPTNYLPTMLLITTPVCILILFVSGGLLLTCDLVKNRFRNLFQKEGFLLLTTLTGLFPFAYASISETPVYNGWRHFYFSYAAMILLAGFCIHKLSNILQKTKGRLFSFCIPITYITFLTVSLILNHPYEYSYYNILGGTNIESKYEMDYWDLSVWQAYDFILKNSPQPNTRVSALNMPTIWGLENNHAALPAQSREQIVLIENWQDADFIIVNTTYLVMYNQNEISTLQTNFELVKTFTSFGNKICEVYCRK